MPAHCIGSGQGARSLIIGMGVGGGGATKQEAGALLKVYPHKKGGGGHTEGGSHFEVVLIWALEVLAVLKGAFGHNNFCPFLKGGARKAVPCLEGRSRKNILTCDFPIL